MSTENSTPRTQQSRDLTLILIRVGLVGLLVVLSARVFAPFMGLMMWALILAVALYPLHLKVVKWLSGRHGRAATLLVVSGILLVGAPTVMIGSAFAGHLHGAYTAFEDKTITLKQPDPSVAEWPLVGKRVYGAWSAAATNLPAFLEEHQAKLKNLSKRLLSVAANTAGSILLFLASLIVAGMIMAWGESGSAAMTRIFSALAGAGTGPQLQSLSTATVRSVAVGVIGIAFIQSLLLGIGFIVAGIPGAGLLALAVLLLGICQLPAAVISLPAIAYLWWAGDSSTLMTIVYSIYLLVAGLVDNVLKPLLLGRGVDAPMPVVLIGALGGLATSGIIGLFVGAVLLSVGYVIFMQWVDSAGESEGAGAKPRAGDGPAAPDTSATG